MDMSPRHSGDGGTTAGQQQQQQQQEYGVTGADVAARVAAAAASVGEYVGGDRGSALSCELVSGGSGYSGGAAVGGAGGERATPEEVVMVCSVCEEEWPSSRLEDHSELCAVLQQVREEGAAASIS
jgi:hypothetical protein